MYTITIDGPAGSGKSTVADIVAKKLNINHLNSGEFYRAITLYMLRNGISFSDEEKIKNALNEIDILVEFDDEKQKIILNGENVSDYLHSNEINKFVAKYAHYSSVVKKCSDLTYLATKTNNLVIDGRNVGSYVVPDAKLKIYLDCDPKIRATRRVKEFQEKGENIRFEDILKQTIERDELDKKRKIAPLVVPKGAHILNSDNKSPDEIADEIIFELNKINS